MRILKIFLTAILTLNCVSIIGQDVTGYRYKIEWPMMYMNKYIKTHEDSVKAQEKVYEKMPEYLDCILIGNDLIQFFWQYDGSFGHANIYSNREQKIFRIDSDYGLRKEKIESRSVVNYNLIENQDSLLFYEIKQFKGIPLKILVSDSINHSTNSYENTFGMQPEISIFTELGIMPIKMVMGNEAMIFKYSSGISYEHLESIEGYTEFLKTIKSKNKRLEYLKKLKPVANNRYI